MGFDKPICSLLSLPSGVDSTSRTFLLGFADGVVRAVLQCSDAWKMTARFKPHSGEYGPACHWIVSWWGCVTPLHQVSNSLTGMVLMQCMIAMTYHKLWPECALVVLHNTLVELASNALPMTFGSASQLCCDLCRPFNNLVCICRPNSRHSRT